VVEECCLLFEPTPTKLKDVWSDLFSVGKIHLLKMIALHFFKIVQQPLPQTGGQRRLTGCGLSLWQRRDGRQDGYFSFIQNKTNVSDMLNYLGFW